MLIFHSFKASGSTFSHLHQRLLKSFKETVISLRHLGKSILEGILYFGLLFLSGKGKAFAFKQNLCGICDLKPTVQWL